MLKKSTLIIAEGLEDRIFLRHLKDEYANCRIYPVYIEDAGGGSVIVQVDKAISHEGAYTTRAVIHDLDRAPEEISLAQNKASLHHIQMIGILPCMEALLLEILRPGKSYCSKTTRWCKHEFESNYIPPNHRTDIYEYARKFPPSLIDSRLEEIPLLLQIIELLNKPT